MSESPPAKRTKRGSMSALAQLPALLAELNGGRALDLAVMAAIKAAGSSAGSGGDAVPANPHDETLQSTINKLFEDHVGKSREIILGNVTRLAREAQQRELDTFNKRQRNSYMGDERDKWLNHPRHGSDCKGPNPDGRVVIELFLGEERAEEALHGALPMNRGRGRSREMNAGGSLERDIEVIVFRLLRDEAPKLSTVEILANILFYLRKEAGKVPMKDLLRFSVLYGLDGAMIDVLRGRYGDADALTVNTLMPLDDKPLPADDGSRFMIGFKAFMPAYALGAILGHENVVTTALAQPGGKIDALCGVQTSNDAEIKERTNVLLSEVFLWVFMKNMPDMIKCLVNQCGFQFRWIEHNTFLPMIFKRIFELAEYETFPRWTGDLDEEELMWCGGSRARCRLRAAAAYKEQMNMLDLLISLGFPFSLFFDHEPPIEREEKLVKEKKLETREQCKAYMRNMDKAERQAREKVYNCCAAYNFVMQKDENYDDVDDNDDDAESETLTLGDYYRKLKSRWDGQETVQVSRLPEFEELDSRWRADRQRQNGEDQDEDESEDSYRDSDDGSSYGEPPWE